MNDQQSTSQVLNGGNNEHNNGWNDDTTFDKQYRVDNHSRPNHAVSNTNDSLLWWVFTLGDYGLEYTDLMHFVFLTEGLAVFDGCDFGSQPDVFFVEVLHLLIIKISYHNINISIILYYLCKIGTNCSNQQIAIYVLINEDFNLWLLFGSVYTRLL